MRNSGGNTEANGRTSKYPSRRAILSATLGAGAAIAAAPTFGAAPAMAADQDGASMAPAPEDYQAKGYGVTSATSGMVPIRFTRRTLAADDVFIDILYCGLCHSDIHTIRGEWGPIAYPCVPGHEIVGRVRAVGRAVTKFKPGDFAGVGTFVDSCRNCANCDRSEEQYCLNNGLVPTYGGTEGNIVYGGFSDRIVVRDRFVMKIPANARLAETAPLLCAGTTTNSPMRHWKLARGQRVGIIGVGGLGHLAVKLAADRGAEVYAFTTTAAKIADAVSFGARRGVLWSDQDAMGQLAGSLDLIISTVPRPYPMRQFMMLLGFEGTFVNLGALEDLQAGVNGFGMAMRRLSLAGSMVGGTAETQQLIEDCVKRDIYPKIEIISVKDLNRAIDRVVAKDARYRFVVDMSTLRQSTRRR